MATFVVCTRCGRVQESIGIDQLPDRWRRSLDDLLCPRCSSTTHDGELGEILDEELILPGDARADTLDEGFCEVCAGPCHGH